MFSFGEMIILGLIAVIFIGPKELPKVARFVGGFMRELKRIAYEFQRQMSLPTDEVNKATEDFSKKIVEGTQKFMKTIEQHTEKKLEKNQSEKRQSDE